MKLSLVPSSELSDQEEIRVGTHAQVGQEGSSSVVRLVVQWAVGTILVFLLGSWLVWWAISLQGQFVEDEIRGACQRVMPETVQRCVDTVIIQRGGARR
jgi:type II secretory pathway component PulL